MENVLKFCVWGKPQPKQSARFSKFGAYQPAKVTNYAHWVRLCFKEKYSSDVRFPANMPLIIKIRAYLPIPQSKSKKFKDQAEKGLIRPITKPDTDNIAKNIKDALNGFAYYDDRQIVTEQIEKWYSADPRVEIIIEGDY